MGQQDAQQVCLNGHQITDLLPLLARISADSADGFKLLENICSRFHLVAKQLRTGHADRDSLIVADEYDVQDLLHALLRVHFDDIRPEEWTPSHAGSSSRVDFLLKEEQIIVEVKNEGKPQSKTNRRAVDCRH